MTTNVPNGQPNWRFMRYVRPPIKDGENDPPLFPLRPETRPLRLGIDVTTVPTPPAGLFTKFLGRNEIDVQLMVPADEQVPSAWTDALGNSLVRRGSSHELLHLQFPTTIGTSHPRRISGRTPNMPRPYP